MIGGFMKRIKRFIKDNDAFGIVEIVLIIIVIVALVIIFKDEITDFVNSAFSSITSKSSSLLE